MKIAREGTEKRRLELMEQIARQRTELAHAYRGLAKPLDYTQKGIKGMKALRQNAWLIGLVPSIIAIVFSLFGWKKKEKASLLSRRSKEEKLREAEAVARKPLAKWAARGWAAFQLYRRVRPFLPL